MKVPIRYKSSDRYNAGVDVVYDDESKLQYAPFVYATTASGDNGGSGEDEEGEDTMVVNAIQGDAALSLDKTWQEIYDAVEDGKYVYIRQAMGDGMVNYYILHIDRVTFIGSKYEVCGHIGAEGIDGNAELRIIKFEANSSSGYPAYSTGGPS